MMKRQYILLCLILFCARIIAQDSFSSTLDKLQNCIDLDKVEMYKSLYEKIPDDSILTSSYSEYARFNKIQGDFYFRYGYIELAIKKYECATDNYLLAGQIDSSYIHTQIKLAESYLKNKNEEEAEKTIRKAIIYCSEILDDCSLSADLFRTCLKIPKYKNDSIVSEQIHQKIQKYAFNYYHKLHPEAVLDFTIEEMQESDNYFRILNELDTKEYVTHLCEKGCLLLESSVLDESMIEFEKALDYAMRIGEIDSLTTSVIWIRLLDVYGKLGETEKIKAFVPKVIKYYASINDNRYSPFQVNYVAGLALVNGEKCNDGLKYLKQAENMLSTLNDSATDLIKVKQNLYSYYLLAYVKLQDDINAYKALELLRDLYPKDSESYYSCLSQLAMYDYQLNNYNNSIKNLKRMGKLAKTLYGSDSKEQEQILKYFGYNYVGLKKYKIAQPYFLKAISLHRQNDPDDIEGFLIYYYDLASAYYMEGDYSSALENYIISEEYCKELYGTVSDNIKAEINKCNNFLK